MKRALTTFWVVFTAVSAVGIGVWWTVRTPDLQRGEPVETEVEVHDLDQPFVRVEGMAHYPVVVKQTVPPVFFWQEEEVFYLFPLFPKHEVEEMAVRVLVRTPREPERFVAYEYMTLEGHLSLPTAAKVPYNMEIQLGKHSDYYFTDEMILLEPWRIEAEDEVWERTED